MEQMLIFAVKRVGVWAERLSGLHGDQHPDRRLQLADSSSVSPTCQFELPLPARPLSAINRSSVCSLPVLSSPLICIHIQMRWPRIVLSMSETLLKQCTSLDYPTLVLVSFAFTALDFCSLWVSMNAARAASLALFITHTHIDFIIGRFLFDLFCFVCVCNIIYTPQTVY